VTQDDWNDEMGSAWARFVESYRRRRAPAALRERIVAALEAAASAGSRREGTPANRGPGARGSDAADVRGQ